jgi:hypothetical protein
LVEKWTPPSRSKIAEIGQKIEGILGVNHCITIVFANLTFFYQILNIVSSNIITKYLNVFS